MPPTEVERQQMVLLTMVIYLLYTVVRKIGGSKLLLMTLASLIEFQ